MQVFKLERSLISNKATLGRLISPQFEELCKTLENPYINNKKYISCIPCGIYYCESFSGGTNKNVWEVKSVPGRTHILFHIGNTEKETQGCILVGQTYGFINDDIAVLNSTVTLDYLRRHLPKKFLLEITSL